MSSQPVPAPELASPKKLSKATTPGLVIWLTRKIENGVPGDWLLERVIAQVDTFKTHLSFDVPQKAQSMICPDVWDGLASFLPADEGKHVTVARQAEVMTDMVLLRGIGVSSYWPTKVLQRAVINVRTMFGRLQGLFQPNRYPDALRDADCKLAVRALNDVLLPALSLVGMDPEHRSLSSSGKAVAFMDRLEANREDIEFYATLLTRFVTGQAQREASVRGAKPPGPLAS